MSNKFRVFHTPINVNFDVTMNIVKACCVLHNFIRLRNGYRIEDTLTISYLQYLQTGLDTLCENILLSALLALLEACPGKIHVYFNLKRLYPVVV